MAILRCKCEIHFVLIVIALVCFTISLLSLLSENSLTNKMNVISYSAILVVIIVWILFFTIQINKQIRHAFKNTEELIYVLKRKENVITLECLTNGEKTVFRLEDVRRKRYFKHVTIIYVKYRGLISFPNTAEINDLFKK